VFGSCGFLSFSSVFCLLGGWFETTLYIHFIRNWVKARRLLRRPAKAEERKKAEKNAVLRSTEHRACGVVSRVRTSAIDAAEARRLARGCCGFVSMPAGLAAWF
jgi:hypothetical protein